MDWLISIPVVGYLMIGYLFACKCDNLGIKEGRPLSFLVWLGFLLLWFIFVIRVIWDHIKNEDS